MNEKIVIDADIEEIDFKDNVALIKDTIEKSKYNLRYLYNFLLLWGALTFFVNIFDIISTNVLYDVEILQGITLLIRSCVPCVLLAYFIVKRKATVKAENIYGVQIYDIWGVSVFLPAFMRLVMHGVYPNKDSNPTFEVCIDMIEIMLVIVAIYITGLLLKNKVVIAASLLCVISIFVYICVCFTVMEFKVETVRHYSYFISDVARKALIVYSAGCAIASGVNIFRSRRGK